MTDAPTPSNTLGAGSLASASIRVFRENPIPFALVLLAPGLINWGLQATLPAPAETTSFSDNLWASVGGSWGIALLYSLISAVIYIFTMVPITLMTFSAAAGRPVRLTEAYAATIPIFGRAFALSFVQAAIMAVVIAGAVLLAWIGLPEVACIVLGAIGMVWVGLQLVVALPALTAGAGPIAALKRSQALTAGYRWPILGAFAGLILLIILTALALVALMVVVGMVLGNGFALVMAILVAVVSAIINIPVYILPTVIYLRLVDVKEGGDSDKIAEVFE